MSLTLLRPWINGRPSPGRRRHRLLISRPWDDRPLAEVEEATGSDLDAAIDGARRAMAVMRSLPLHRRREILLRTAAGLRSSRAALGRLIGEDAGKPLTLALGEVDRAIWTFTIAAEELHGPRGEHGPADIDPRGEGLVALTDRFPVGPIAGISPFNFPLNLVAHQVAWRRRCAEARCRDADGAAAGGAA